MADSGFVFIVLTVVCLRLRRDQCAAYSNAALCCSALRPSAFKVEEVYPKVVKVKVVYPNASLCPPQVHRTAADLSRRFPRLPGSPDLLHVLCHPGGPIGGHRPHTHPSTHPPHCLSTHPPPTPTSPMPFPTYRQPNHLSHTNRTTFIGPIGGHWSHTQSSTHPLNTQFSKHPPTHPPTHPPPPTQHPRLYPSTHPPHHSPVNRNTSNTNSVTTSMIVYANAWTHEIAI